MWSYKISSYFVKDFKKLDKAVLRVFIKKMEQIINSEKPKTFLVSLIGNFEGFYKVRIGDWRIILYPKEEGDNTILIVCRIAHRSESYSTEIWKIDKEENQ